MRGREGAGDLGKDLREAFRLLAQKVELVLFVAAVKVLIFHDLKYA